MGQFVTVYQGQRYGCGYAVIKMALIHSSKRKDFAYAPEPISPKEPPSLTQLLAYAGQLGLKLGAYKLRDPRELLMNKQYPLLINIKDEDKGTLHMVYLIKKRRKKYLIIDPSLGKRWMKQEELMSCFSGIFLREEGYVELGNYYSKNRPIPMIKSLFPSVLSLFAMASILIGCYLISDELSPFWSLAFFGLTGVSILLQRCFLLSSMKKFDEKYLDNIDCYDKERRKDNYMRYYLYKSAAFSTYPSLIAGLVEVVAMAVILSLNDLNMGLMIAGLFSALLLDRLLLYPRYARAEKSLEKREDDYWNCNDASSRKRILKEISKDSSTLGTALSFRSVVLGIIIAVICLTSMLGESNSLNRFLFYFMALYFICHELDRCFSLADKLEDKRKLEAYFIYNFLGKT